MRTPAGRNREELEIEALKFYLTGTASIENMAVSKPGDSTKFLKGLLGVMVHFERTS